MKINRSLSDKALLQELGRRLGRHRLNRNLTQAELAREAGMAKRTLERIEAGEPSQLVNVLRLCRVLGLLDAWDQLLPAPPVSPLQQVRRQGRGRQRASARDRHKQQTETWHWGDEDAGDES